MTLRCGRFIAIVIIAMATGRFVALSTFPAQGQSQSSDGPAWCDTTWACDTVGPTSRPADGKFAADASGQKGAYIATGQASADAARNLALSKCVAANGDQFPCDMSSVSKATTGCIAVAGKPGWVETIWHNDTSTRVDAWNQVVKNCIRGYCHVEITACAGDDPRIPPRFPLPPDFMGGKVDPALVGTWEIPMHPGRWVWEIAANGTYEFHTEAPDDAPSHAGILTANSGTWSLVSVAGITDKDSGTYLMQGPDTMVMTGKSGSAGWQRVKGAAPAN